MKILILQDDFPPYSFGGAGVVAFNLAKGLQELGHQVYVITAVQDKAKAGRLDYQGLTIFRIYSNYRECWRAYLSLYNPQTVNYIKKAIKEINPDIIHVHNIHYYLSYYCLKIAKKYSKAVFLTAHDVMLFHYGKLIEFVNSNDLSIPKNFNYKITFWQQIKQYKRRYNPLRNIVIKHYLGYVDKIFAVSHALKDALSQNNIKNVEVIYNGIDVAQWQINDEKVEEFKKKYNLFNKKIVFFAGRLGAFKGGGKIIRIMGAVVKQIPNAVLLVAGRKDSYAQEMSELAESKNVPLILTGWIGGDDLKSAYYSSDIIVTPSIYLDPFNLINIEGMICKKPIVGTRFGGTVEIIIDNKTGYIVNPFDTQTMAKKIVDLLKNHTRAEQFGLAGHNRVKQKFSSAKQVGEYLEQFKKITNSN